MEALHGAIPMDVEARAACQALLRQLREDPSSAPFRQPVARKKVPLYYEIIQQPMDLKTIETNLASGAFRTLEAFANALRLVWRNAFVFNEKGDRHGRLVFEHAVALALATEEAVEALYAERLERTGEPVPAMQRLQLELFHMRANPLALWFRDPVSPELCPDYHARIGEPMDLHTCLTAIDYGQITKPAQLEAAVHLIWTNARQYNGEGSAIDAAALVCCVAWNARYARVVGSAPRQRKLRRVEASCAGDALRLLLLDLCRYLPAAQLREVGVTLGAHVVAPDDDGRNLTADLSNVGSAELAAAVHVARTYLLAHQPVGVA
ncbi:hypothetical protein KFE25_009701 [Diacronema lutheri]|uniref:Bromo domain-containing protein n=1 Tax=Diacronema lutheri TaxID=2081491 RepID=A0A8J5Y419_DIALT|nr:hypothetical protein KFE25_009701 [Diacronema lutheri]